MTKLPLTNITLIDGVTRRDHIRYENETIRMILVKNSLQGPTCYFIYLLFYVNQGTKLAFNSNYYFYKKNTIKRKLKYINEFELSKL